MTLHVRFQTVALCEGLLAQGALVGSLSVVRPHVDRQVFLPRTRLPANAAHEQFDAQVRADVIGQVSLAFEEASALGAAVWRLARVHPHVHLQLAIGQEAFAAHDADERALVAVSPHVSREAAVGQEGLAADVAQVRTVSHRVDLGVRLQGVCEFEAFAANFAAVATLAGVRGFVAR